MSLGGGPKLESFGESGKVKMASEYYEPRPAQPFEALEISPERIDKYNEACQKIEKTYSDEEGDHYSPEVIAAKGLKKDIEKITRLEETLSKFLAVDPEPEDAEKYQEYLIKLQTEIHDLKIKLGEEHA